MKVFVVVAVFVVASVKGHQFEPAECDWEKEMSCPGRWNYDWTAQLTPDFCIPFMTGDCENMCHENICCKGVTCPGGMDDAGCMQPDFCMPEGSVCPASEPAIEPANCNDEQMMCSGEWNEDWTKQLTSDFCIAMKEGDCYNVCPMDCGKDYETCPMGMDDAKCKMPDVCVPKGTVCPSPFVPAVNTK